MEKKLQPKHIITCPHCGHQYLAGEVLEPEQVLGQPTEIIKDPLGKVLFNEWKEEQEPLAEDTYYCDNCGRPFVIEIEVSYKTKAQSEELDFTSTASLL